MAGNLTDGSVVGGGPCCIGRERNAIYIYIYASGRPPIPVFEFNGSSDERESSTFWRKGWLATMGE